MDPSLRWGNGVYGNVMEAERGLALLTHTIFGVPVAVLQTASAIALIEAALVAHRRLNVVFCNAHTLNLAVEDAAYREILARCLCLNDGIGVDLASRLLYQTRFPENLNGTDFTPALLDQIARPLRIYLLGAKPGVVARVAQAMAARWPRHTVTGFRSGYFGSAEAAQVADAVRAAQPDLVLIAMGNPRQEQWADAFTGFDGVTMSVGAWFDFFAGEVPRAPALFRRLRVEWLFRLGLEPGRMWRRYLVGNAVFLARVAGQRLRSK